MRRGVVVTGVNGFLGAAVSRAMMHQGYFVSGTVRDLTRLTTSSATHLHHVFPVGTINGSTDWRPALKDAQAVVHTAAANTSKRTSLHELTEINVDATAALARQAAAMGVERFIFISSIKVHGESTSAEPFCERDICSPKGPYAVSKLCAEKLIARIHDETGLQTIIIRPTLIYGPGVRGSFYHLMQAVDRRWPVPFGALNNRRSMISVQNLSSLLTACVGASLAPQSVFVAADPEPLSTPEWIHEISCVLGRAPLLLPCSPRLLSLTAGICGLARLHEKLCLSLEVNAAEVRHRLGWNSQQSRHQALMETAAWYRSYSRR